MSEWIKFSKQVPEFGIRVLVLFSDSNHIEDAVILQMNDPEEGWYYLLFDGETLNCKPKYWAQIPTLPEQDK